FGADNFSSFEKKSMQIFKTCLVIGAIVIKTATYAQVDDSTLRKVDLQGAVNFRDIGGYKTNDGKTIKWGKIYRAAEINKLTNQDALALE
ncbi:tyrosine-protein phosphatase, partial [Klebsiella pneumoniae]|uniref:tyrosine-protein phosphatase n=1 Tax=Klebsiella pneumoniae TaxID=573 RepID=UPI0038541315